MAKDPAHCERTAGTAERGSTTRLREHAARKVLYVEDDEDSREALKMFFEMRGCEFTGASTVADGLDALREQRFDLVITDYNLPDQDGVAMLETAISDGLLTCEAVIVTGSYRIQGRTPARVLTKPVDPRELLAIIERRCD